MPAFGKIEVPVEAKVMIRVGDKEVELRELADALTRAGIELQALIAPSLLDAEVEVVEVRSPLDDLRPNEGIYRDRDGELRRIEVHRIDHAANVAPRVEGHVIGRI